MRSCDAWRALVIPAVDSYKYYGVISGWDAHCCMPLQWINQMRVFQLTHGANQPFYSTLVGDGTTRYVAQGVCVCLCVCACVCMWNTFSFSFLLGFCAPL